MPKYLSCLFFCLPCLFFCVQPARAYEKLFEQHCREAKVPKDVALAIARQESGLNRLCINIEGEDLTPGTQAEAEEIILRAQAQDLSYDVGIMQINSQWIKKWKIDPLTLLDPGTNIRLGLRILKEEIQRHGLNWKAVGAYHSPNPARAMRYASQVMGRMNGRGNALALSPRLQLLVQRGVITHAEARAILANPRLNNPMRRKNMRALRAKLYGASTQKSAALDNYDQLRGRKGQ